MHSNKKYSHSKAAFQVSIISLCIVLAFVITLSVIPDFAFFIGIPFFISGIISILGLIFNIRGIKEPSSPSKYVGLTINTLLSLLFIYIMIQLYLGQIKS